MALSLIATSLPAQKKTFDQKGITPVTFYGIDYTKAKTYGAKESGTFFLAAYKAINQLMAHEADKFSVESHLKLPAHVYKTSFAIDRLEAIDPKNILTQNVNYSLTDDEVIDVLNSYDFEGESGYGVLFVAELLDKANAKATYTVIVFDVATKGVVFMKKAWGEAGGAGLRNFWANSAYDMMKRWNWKY